MSKSKIHKSSIFFVSLGFITTLVFSVSSCNIIQNNLIKADNDTFLYNDNKFSDIASLEDFVFPEINDINLKNLNHKRQFEIMDNTFYDKNSLYDFARNKISLSSDEYYLNSQVNNSYGPISSSQVFKDDELNIVSIYKTANGQFTTDKNFAIQSYYSIDEQFTTKYYNDLSWKNTFASKEAAINWLENSLLSSDQNVKEIRVYDPGKTGASLTYNEFLNGFSNYIDRYVKVGHQYYNINNLRDHIDDVRLSIQELTSQLGIKNSKHPGLWNIGINSASPGDFIGHKYYSGMVAPTSILTPTNWVVDSAMEAGLFSQVFSNKINQRKSANAKLEMAVSINEWTTTDTKEVLTWKVFFNRMIHSLASEYGTNFINNFKKLIFDNDIYNTGAMAWDESIKIKNQGILHSFANSIIALFSKVEKSANSINLIYYMNKFFKEGTQYFNTILKSLGFHVLFSPNNDIYNSFYKRYTSDLYNLGSDSNVSINLIDGLLDGSFTYGVSTSDDSEVTTLNDYFHAITGGFMQFNMMRARLLQTYKVIRSAARHKFLEPMPGGGFDVHMEHHEDIINSLNPAVEELNINSNHNSDIWLPGRGTEERTKLDGIRNHELWGELVDIEIEPLEGASLPKHIITGDATMIYHTSNYDDITVRYLCHINYDDKTTSIFQVDTGITRIFKFGDKSIPELEFPVDGEIRLIKDKEVWKKILIRDPWLNGVDNFHQLGSPMIFTRGKGGILAKDGQILVTGKPIWNVRPNINYDHVNVLSLFSFDVAKGYTVYDVETNRIIFAKSYVELPSWFRRLKIGQVREISDIDMLQIQHGQMADNIWNFHQLGVPSPINDFGGNQKAQTYNLVDKTPLYLDNHTRFYVHIDDFGHVTVFDRETRFITIYENPQSVPRIVFEQQRRYLSSSEVEILKHGRLEINFSTFGTPSYHVLEPSAHYEGWTKEEVSKIKHPYYIAKRWIQTKYSQALKYIVVSSNNHEVLIVSSLTDLPNPVIMSTVGDVIEIPYELMKKSLKNKTLKNVDFQIWNEHGEIFHTQNQISSFLNWNSNFAETKVPPPLLNPPLAESFTWNRDYGGSKFLVFCSDDPLHNPNKNVWVFDRHARHWTLLPSMDSLPIEVWKAPDTRIINDSEYSELTNLYAQDDKSAYFHKLSTIGRPLSETTIEHSDLPYRWYVNYDITSSEDTPITVIDFINWKSMGVVKMYRYNSIDEVSSEILQSPLGSSAIIRSKDLIRITDAIYSPDPIRHINQVLIGAKKYIQIQNWKEKCLNYYQKNVRYVYLDLPINENPAEDDVYILDFKTGRQHKFHGINGVPTFIRSQPALIRAHSMGEFKELFKLNSEQVQNIDYSTYNLEIGNTFADFTPEEVWHLPPSKNLPKWFSTNDNGTLKFLSISKSEDGQLIGEDNSYRSWYDVPNEIKESVYGTIINVKSSTFENMLSLLHKQEFADLEKLLFRSANEESIYYPNDHFINMDEHPSFEFEQKFTTHATALTNGNCRFVIDISSALNGKVDLWDVSKIHKYEFKNLHSVPRWIVSSTDVLWVKTVYDHIKLITDFFQDYTNKLNLGHGLTFTDFPSVPSAPTDLFSHSYLQEPIIPLYYVTYDNKTRLFSTFSVNENKAWEHARLIDHLGSDIVFGTTVELSNDKFNLLLQWHNSNKPINFNYLNDGSSYIEIAASKINKFGLVDEEAFNSAYREKVVQPGLTSVQPLPESNTMIGDLDSVMKSQYKYYVCIHNGPKTEEEWNRLSDNIKLIGIFDTQTGIGSYYTIDTMPKGFHSYLNSEKVHLIDEDNWIQLANGNYKILDKINADNNWDEQLAILIQDKMNQESQIDSKNGKMNSKWAAHYSLTRHMWLVFNSITYERFEFSDWFSIPPLIRLSNSLVIIKSNSSINWEDDFYLLVEHWAKTNIIPLDFLGNMFEVNQVYKPNQIEFDLSLGSIPYMGLTHIDPTSTINFKPNAHPMVEAPETNLNLGWDNTWNEIESMTAKEEIIKHIDTFYKIAVFLESKKLYDGHESHSNLLVEIHKGLQSPFVLHYMDVGETRYFQNPKDFFLFLRSCSKDIAISFSNEETERVMYNYHTHKSWNSWFDHEDLLRWINLGEAYSIEGNEDLSSIEYNDRVFGNYLDVRYGILTLLSFVSHETTSIIGSTSKLFDPNWRNCKGIIMGLVGSSTSPSLVVIDLSKPTLECSIHRTSLYTDMLETLEYIRKIDVSKIVFVKSNLLLLKLWKLDKDFSNNPNDDFSNQISEIIFMSRSDHIIFNQWFKFDYHNLSSNMQNLINVHPNTDPFEITDHHGEVHQFLNHSLPHVDFDWDNLDNGSNNNWFPHDNASGSYENINSGGGSPPQPPSQSHIDSGASAVTLPPLPHSYTDSSTDSSTGSHSPLIPTPHQPVDTGSSIGTPPPLPQPYSTPHQPVDTGSGIGTPPPLPQPYPTSHSYTDSSTDSSTGSHSPLIPTPHQPVDTGSSIGTPPPLPQPYPASHSYTDSSTGSNSPLIPTPHQPVDTGSSIGTPPSLPQPYDVDWILHLDSGSDSLGGISVRKKRSISLNDESKSKNANRIIKKLKEMKMSTIFKGVSAILNGFDSIGLFLQFIDGFSHTQRIIYRSTLPNGQIVRWNGAINTKYFFSMIKGEETTINNAHFEVHQLVKPCVVSSFVFDGQTYSSEDEAVQFLTNSFIVDPLKFINKYNGFFPCYFKTKTSTNYHSNLNSIKYELLKSFKIKYTNGYGIYNTKADALNDLQNKKILDNSQLIERKIFIPDLKNNNQPLFSLSIPMMISSHDLKLEIQKLKTEANKYVENELLQTKKVLWADIVNNKYVPFDSMNSASRSKTRLFSANIFGFTTYFRTEASAINYYLSIVSQRGILKITSTQTPTLSFKFHNKEFTSIEAFKKYLIRNYKIS